MPKPCVLTYAEVLSLASTLETLAAELRAAMADANEDDSFDVYTVELGDILNG